MKQGEKQFISWFWAAWHNPRVAASRPDQLFASACPPLSARWFGAGGSWSPGSELNRTRLLLSRYDSENLIFYIFFDFEKKFWENFSKFLKKFSKNLFFLIWKKIKIPFIFALAHKNPRILSLIEFALDDFIVQLFQLAFEGHLGEGCVHAAHKQRRMELVQHSNAARFCDSKFKIDRIQLGRFPL